MDYREALDYIYSRLPMYQRIGPAAYKPDLHNTIALVSTLGNPHWHYPGIHVAGTNGKGSVSSLIASTLMSAGYRTGLFTSPHLVDYRERIKIDGQLIDQDFVTLFISSNIKLFDRVQPSFFEVSFAMAALWFQSRSVDVVVWETGMGGRLDSTNLVRPVVSVITNIGLDHMQFLGESKAKIAAEKAGIIKARIPVVIGERQAETDIVFAQQAESLSSSLTFACDRWELEVLEYDPLDEFLTLNVMCDGVKTFYHLLCGLPGLYQAANVITALAALEVIATSFPHREDHIRTGFRDVRSLTGIAGRWLKINDHPRAYCDTGHNVDGLREVVKLLAMIEKRRLLIVFGMVDDKDADSLLSLLPTDASYYFCQAQVPRAMDAVKLQAVAYNMGLTGNVVKSCRQAYNMALIDAGPDDFVFVGGSTFVVAEVVPVT